MEAGRLLALAIGDLVAARQVVRVGLHQRPDRVRLPQRLEVRGLRALRLPPRAEVERRRGRGLATDPGGEAPQCVGRPRPGVQLEHHPRVVDLDRPRRPEAEDGVVVVAHQQPGAARRQQPRDREVGRVGAVVLSRQRDEPADERELERLVRALRDAVVDLAARSHDRVGPLAEAEEALARDARVKPTRMPSTESGAWIVIRVTPGATVSSCGSTSAGDQTPSRRNSTVSCENGSDSGRRRRRTRQEGSVRAVRSRRYIAPW